MNRKKGLHIRLKPDKSVRVKKTRIGRVPVLIIKPADIPEVPVGILWIHGGGYILGMKEMIYMSRAMDLVKKYGAMNDCYSVLSYMDENHVQLGFDRIMVGGESAGGGLCAAVCMMARDRGIHVAFQMPLYPMISNVDTESSKDNHGRVWNTRRNHMGWRAYLRKQAKEKVSP